MKKLGKVWPVYCLAVCILLVLAACGKDGASDPDAVSSESAVPEAVRYTQGREWVYVPEVITVGDAGADYGRMQPVGDALCYVALGKEGENGAKSICRYSLTDRELAAVPIQWPEGGDDWDMGYRFFARDQSLYMTANVYPADSGSMKRFLCRLDSEGKNLFSKDITEQAGRDVSLRGLTVDSQGRIYMFLDNGEILLYTGDGEYYNTVVYGSPENQVPAQIKGACEGADGRFYVCVSQETVNIAGKDAEETEDARCTLMEIDFENARLLEVAGNLPNIKGLCGGTRRGGDSDSQYDILLYDDKSVYGYRLDSQKSNPQPAGEELFRWMDSDINGYCVTNLYLLEDGRLCAMVEDWINDDMCAVALERTKAEQAPWREELVLATVEGGSDLATMAAKFNRGNSRYHLTVKSYESLTDLYNAILTKEPLDLIDLSGVNVQKLAARGLFENLAPYVKQSEKFGPSDFVDGILDVYTCDDILVGIPAEFMLRTVVGRAARLDNGTGLTLEELLSIEDRCPGAKAFDGVTKEEMMQYLMMFNEDAFIDWDTGTCRFDSESFQAILEYVARFPDQPISGKEEEPLSARIQNGEVLFAVAELYPPFILQDYVKMFGEDAACVGFPTADGRGGHLLIGTDAYGIAAVSQHKESAWAFIEEVLAQGKKSELYTELFINYPSLKSVLDERVGAAVEMEYMEEQDVDAVLKLIPDATPFYSAEEDEIIRIINEEAAACYSGQKGAADVAAIIQNRVQVYVNENR